MSTIPLPPLSANALFHFTNSFDNLINILTEEFRPRFCLENLSVLWGTRRSKPALELAIPMVCFCDLPLSQTSFHLSVYGDYGIGLTKDWGKRNGIAPVLYTYAESMLTSQLVIIMKRIGKSKAKLARDLQDDLSDVFNFVKPYEGELWREGRIIPNLRFYNEREWRFVCTLPKGERYREGMPKAVFLDEDKRREANTRIASMSRISFEPNDIKYLIVRREDEIVPLIRQVEAIKGKYGYEDVRLLASRVISTEQIRSDF